MRNVPLAWLQLTRERRRFTAALAGITFAVTLMLMQLGLRAVLYTAATRIPDHLTGELVMTSAHYEYLYATKPFSERDLYRALAIEGVASVAPLYLAMGNWRDPSALREHKIFVIGVQPSAEVLDLPGLRQHLLDLQSSDSVLFDEGSRPEFGPVAELLSKNPNLYSEVNGHRMKVTGVFELGATFGSGGHLITNYFNFARLFARPLGLIDVGVIRLKPGTNPATIRSQLASMLPRDVLVMTRDDFSDQERSYWAKRVAIGFIFNLGSVLGLLVGSVIVYQILYTDVTDHLNEYATLKAIGYRDRQLSNVVLQEAIILSVLGFIPGYVIAQVLYVLARHQAYVPMEMTVVRVIFVFLVTLGMCAISASIAMRKLKVADPAEIF